MKVTGIVAEYNPFHNGHKYQLEYSKDKLKSDVNVVIMSGDWVQRGAPAIVSKYTRAEMALKSGADMIIEMPTIYSVSSAEGFARSAVSTLNHMGCIDSLLFGAEHNKISYFYKAAEEILRESEEYKAILKDKLASGLNYPLAREYALKNSLPDLPEEFFSSPNNILGIEYVKALLETHSEITPYTNHRIQNDYHSISFESDFASATAIRHVLTTGRKDDGSQISDVKGLLSHVLPQSATEILTDQNASPIIRNDFSMLLQKSLYDHDNFTAFVDCTDDISNKIIKNKQDFINWKQFAEALKSKDLTHTRISRVLSHILLNITDDIYEVGKNLDYAPYIRILGFSENGAKLLPILKEKANIPVITNVNDAELNKLQQRIFDMDIYASDIYRIVESQKCGIALPNEFTRKYDLANIAAE